MRLAAYTSAILVSLLAVGSATARQPAFATPHISQAELGAQRGGFVVVEGITVGFGAVMRSWVDGQLVLETRFTLTPEGMAIARGEGAGGLTAADLSSALGRLGFGPDAQGSVAVTADGQTTLAHQMSPDQLTSLIQNSSDGREIRQQTDLTLTLPGFEATQADMSAAQAARQLTNDMADSLVAAARGG